MSQRVKVYGVLALLVAAAAAYYFNGKYHWIGGVASAKEQNGPNKAGEKKDAKNAKEATPVELATATRGEISSFIASTGNLRALRDVIVTTQAEGVVKEVLSEEGDFVKDGQVLVQLDDAQLKIKLELAKEKLEQARLQKDKARIKQEKAGAQMGHTRAELSRYEKAHKEGLVSEKEVAAYRYKLEEFQHDERVGSSETKEFQHHVAELQAEIAQAELEIARAQIRASFAGYLTQRTVNLGQRVRPQDPMFHLGSFSPLYADVFLSEREARLVKPRQPAEVQLNAADIGKVSGRVERVSPVVDQATGTVKVTIELRPQSAAFRPGAFVRVDIRTDTRAEAVLIPKRAVLEEDGVNYVYVAQGDSVKRKKVGLGFENQGRVEIRDGILVGQKVVVAGQGALKEGSKIRILQG